jgi:hypothetical protein
LQSAAFVHWQVLAAATHRPAAQKVPDVHGLPSSHGESSGRATSTHPPDAAT